MRDACPDCTGTLKMIRVWPKWEAFCETCGRVVVSDTLEGLIDIGLMILLFLVAAWVDVPW